MDRARGCWLLLLALLPAEGCSFLAKKTPTPAADIVPAELAHMPAPPHERYYLFLFGSQDPTRRPAYTHTWASLVRAIDVPRCNEPALEVHTISWLPTELKINALSFRVESGRNYELHETIDYALRTRQKIAMWGPYEVWHGFVHRFMTQKQFLDSGAVGYQCIDTVGEAARQGNGCDCIHAISDMDPAYPRWRYPLALYGQPATGNLVRRMMHSPIFIDPPTTHDWLISKLGLSCYPIERREYRGKVVPHEDGGPAGLEYAAPALRPKAPAVPKKGAPSVLPVPAPKAAPVQPK
jgi:hypothetical protein